MTRFLALFLILAWAHGARADAIQNWRSDPAYTEIQSLCVPQSRVLSLENFQSKLDLASMRGMKDGVLTLFGKNAADFDPALEKEWQSEPFYLGLLDCLGNDSTGVFLAKAFVIEELIDYQLTKATTLAALTVSGARLISWVARFGFTSLRGILLGNTAFREFLLANPQLFPRTQAVLKWLIRGGYVATIGIGTKNVFDKTAAQAQKEIAVVNAGQDMSLAAKNVVSNDKQLEIDQAKATVLQLQKRAAKCEALHHPQERCDKIKAAISKIQSLILEVQN